MGKTALPPPPACEVPVCTEAKLGLWFLGLEKSPSRGEVHFEKTALSQISGKRQIRIL